MNIDYKITEVKPNVFAVIIPNQYDRAMTFCRVQEFYESPNPYFSFFKNNSFIVLATSNIFSTLIYFASGP